MTELLVRCFIRDSDHVEDAKVRQAYGRLSGLVGIVCNVILFTCKLLAGLMTGAVSIMADAFNNLSDAASSIVTLIGFYMAGKPADPDHPFGHGRIEYLSGLFVAAAILMTGFELLKTSVEKILHPEALSFSAISIVILIASILMKMWMARFNFNLGHKIKSQAMQATATDSLSDCIATSAVLVGVIVTMITGKNIDGFIGVLVALFVCVAGFNAAKETIQPLLGQAPDPDLVDNIKKRVMQEDMILGIHDLVIHDYGPGRRMITLHAEISYKEDIMEAHDMIDNVERDLMQEFQCTATIHMDPVVTDDEELNLMREKVEALVRTLDASWKIHDFRMVRGNTHSNLIFDLVVPTDALKDKFEIEAKVRDLIHIMNPNYNAVITVEQSYV
ncbi:cation diffusion facilitator family transporter [Frisingicoccus sp.]|uniref:cation diffusion facilitator family transporter n=1 Tax=Frisingicoccus sp. TaxID=1918627 RepID=UPI002EAFD524|nr:cation diffusion facilitator family transporter [Frisingicoccus sp.]